MRENSIEEDIKILEEFIDKAKQYNPKTGKDIKPIQFGEGQSYVYSNVYYGIAHILSDHKRILKENELAKQALIKNCNIADERNQLLKENEELKADNYELNNLINDLLDNIPVQKLKDKINKINQEYTKQQARLSIRDYFNQKEAVSIMQELRWVADELQELIEESEDK